jgi:hypothetical protein
VPILSQRALLPLLLARTPAELGAASVVHGGFRQVAGHHIRHGGRRGGAPPRRATPAAHCLSPSPALSPRRPRRELSPGKGASSLVRCIGSCGGPSRIPLDPPRYEGSRGAPPFSRSPPGDRCGASSGKTHRHPDGGGFPGHRCGWSHRCTF